MSSTRASIEACIVLSQCPSTKASICYVADEATDSNAPVQLVSARPSTDWSFRCVQVCMLNYL